MVLEGIDQRIGQVIVGAMDIKEEGKDVLGRQIGYDEQGKRVVMFGNKKGPRRVEIGQPVAELCSLKLVALS